MSNMQGKKGVQKKRGRAWSDANKQGLKARTYLDNIPKGLKLKYGASPQNRVLAVRKSVYPIPDVLVTKLRTSWTQTITTGAAGVFGSGSYYLNSCNDPSNAVGAFQPRFFDQLMAIYERYTVYGVKIRIKVLQPSATGNQRILFIPSRNAAVPIADCYSDGNEIGGTMLLDPITSTTVNYAGNVNGSSMVTRYVDVGSYFGRDQESIMDEENFSGTASTDPSNILYLYFCTQSIGAVQNSTVVEVQFTQYLALRGVKIPATST